MRNCSVALLHIKDLMPLKLFITNSKLSIFPPPASEWTEAGGGGAPVPGEGRPVCCGHSSSRVLSLYPVCEGPAPARPVAAQSTPQETRNYWGPHQFLYTPSVGPEIIQFLQPHFTPGTTCGSTLQCQPRRHHRIKFEIKYAALLCLTYLISHPAGR